MFSTPSLSPTVTTYCTPRPCVQVREKNTGGRDTSRSYVVQIECYVTTIRMDWNAGTSRSS